MQPFEVKLDYQGRPWCTVNFKLGHNEIGLEPPRPVRVMRADHQIAQKLHAVSAAGSERAHDLVDLQLLAKGEDLDVSQVRATCVRLFEYRRQQTWPPAIQARDSWSTLYATAVENLDVVPDMDEAVAWTNAFVVRIAGDDSGVSA